MLIGAEPFRRANSEEKRNGETEKRRNGAFADSPTRRIADSSNPHWRAHVDCRWREHGDWARALDRLYRHANIREEQHAVVIPSAYPRRHPDLLGTSATQRIIIDLRPCQLSHQSRRYERAVSRKFDPFAVVRISSRRSAGTPILGVAPRCAPRCG